MNKEQIYFKQLLSGRDFAMSNPLAPQLLNFIYLIGDRKTKECMVIDPAWSVDEILGIFAEDGMQLTGVLATHYHPDHLGGDLMGMAHVEGAKELLEAQPMKIHCHQEESPWIVRRVGVTEEDLILHEDGEEINIGELAIRCIHTPGHSPGGMCYSLDGILFSGDTLFIDGCGRTDLPGGDGEEILVSIQQRLAEIPDEAILYAGHRYSNADFATLGEVRRTNFVFQARRI